MSSPFVLGMYRHRPSNVRVGSSAIKSTASRPKPYERSGGRGGRAASAGVAGVSGDSGGTRGGGDDHDGADRKEDQRDWLKPGHLRRQSVEQALADSRYSRESKGISPKFYSNPVKNTTNAYQIASGDVSYSFKALPPSENVTSTKTNTVPSTEIVNTEKTKTVATARTKTVTTAEATAQSKTVIAARGEAPNAIKSGAKFLLEAWKFVESNPKNAGLRNNFGGLLEAHVAQCLEMGEASRPVHQPPHNSGDIVEDDDLEEEEEEVEMEAEE